MSTSVCVCVCESVCVCVAGPSSGLSYGLIPLRPLSSGVMAASVKTYKVEARGGARLLSGLNGQNDHWKRAQCQDPEELITTP